jgi:hypothetical protein
MVGIWTVYSAFLLDLIDRSLVFVIFGGKNSCLALESEAVHVGICI